MPAPSFAWSGGETQGECEEGSDRVRTAALQALLAGGGEDDRDLLREVVRSDDPCHGWQLRSYALHRLLELEPDRSVEILREVLATTDDARLLRTAVARLGELDEPVATEAFIELVEAPDAPIGVRRGAVHALARGPLDPPETELLRDLFDRVEEARLRQDILVALSSSRRPEDRDWLRGRVLDVELPVSLRRVALLQLLAALEREDAQPGSLAELYPSLRDEPQLLSQLLFGVSRSDDPEAVRILMEVAREEENVRIRTQAIHFLGERDEPEVRELLREILRGGE